jgi:hypothetical protein
MARNVVLRIAAVAERRKIHLHHTTKLDGRIVAQNTLKHMARPGNMQTVGTRLADYSITRPMPV